MLLPIDAAGRVLEVALLLDKHWERAKLHFTLVLACTPGARGAGERQDAAHLDV